MFRIGLSTCGKPFGEALFRGYREAGIDVMEVSMDKEGCDAFDFALAQRLSAAYEVPLWSFHLPFMPFEQIDISRPALSKVIRHLSQMEMDVKIRSMAVGDYQVSDDVVIERKTAKDFVDSIIDKRLFKQARELSEEFKHPIIILEGDDIYNGMIHPNAVRGTLATLAIDFGISILPTRDSQDTAAMIKRIAVREQDGEKNHIQIRTDKKPVSLWEQQLFIIESLPNIGPVNAKNLLQHFGSVEKVITASESELQEVEGIGKKTAENIRKVVESKYLYFESQIKEKKLL